MLGLAAIDVRVFLLFVIKLLSSMGLSSSNLHHAQTDLDRIASSSVTSMLYSAVCCLFDI